MAFQESKGRRAPRIVYQTRRKSDRRFYDSKVDYEILESMGVKFIKHEPWQIGLFYPDLSGKFLWYPSKGTLVYESADGFFSRVGEKGDFVAGGYDADSARESVTEDVYEEIMKMVNQQHSV